MRIAELNTTSRGSTGKIACDILSSLPESDDKLLIYGIGDSDYEYAEKIGSKLGSFMHIAYNRLFGRHARYSYFNTKRIVRRLKKFKPDILHLHNLHGYYMNYKPLFRYIKKNNINVVWTLHDCWTFTGFCYHFERTGCEKWKTQCEHCIANYRDGYMKSWYFDTSASEYKSKKKSFTSVENMTIVAPCEWLANLARESYFKKYDIRVINNGVNLDNFKPTDEHRFDDVIDRSKKIILGVASPFEDDKGFSDFIALSRIIPEDYIIVLVGISEEQLASLPSNVVGFRRTNNQVELAELYSIAYVFANFTYEDTFPTVNIEALSCGTPIICYKTGGACEMLDEDNSFVIAKGDYAKVVELLPGVARLREHSDEFRRLANIKYSREAMTGQYVALFNEILSK